MKDNKIDWKELIHNPKFILLCVVVLLLIIVMIIAAVNAHKNKETETAEGQYNNKYTAVQSYDADSSLQVMQEAWAAGLETAQQLVGKTVTLSGQAAYVDNEEGKGIVYDANEFAITCYANTDDLRYQVIYADPSQPITTTGKIKSVDEDGYYLDIQQLDYTALPDADVAASDDTASYSDSSYDDSYNESYNEPSYSEPAYYDEPVYDEQSVYDPAADIPEGATWSAKKSGNSYLLYADDINMVHYTGLCRVRIDGKEKLYYFKKGKYVPNANAIVTFNGKDYMVYEGYARTEFTGTYVLDGVKHTITKGVVQD